MMGCLQNSGCAIKEIGWPWYAIVRVATEDEPAVVGSG